MNGVKKNKKFKLINPRNNKSVGELKCRDVFNLIVESAWESGDPGIIFIDEINRRHPIASKIEATNPCAEQPLLPYESCNLGSINLSRMTIYGKVNWEKLERAVRIAVHFLDNVIDANKFPLKQIEKITKANRKIGLGVMGWADMLFELGIPYNSQRAVNLAEKLMKFISKTARKASAELGKKRGSFPNFKKSKWSRKYKYMRNATVTTIAPTGTISIIAGCSSGIEPVFSISFLREVLEGAKLFELNSVFEKVAEERDFYKEEIIKEIARKGSLREIKGIPKDVKRVFVTAFDISPEWHVKMQAAFQKHTDNSVSKTINLPNGATKKDVKKIFILAYKLKCKGITIYRYGSKKKQVLYVGPEYRGRCVACD